jgi:hypothetical protein
MRVGGSLRGGGVGQQGGTSQQANYGLVDNPASFYFVTDERAAHSEVDLATACTVP